MKHHIDPTVDCVFKAVLGKEENKNLLLHFLNAILKLEEHAQIQDVVVMNPYNEREFESDKLSVVDIKARDDQGKLYQIEIQLVLHAGLTSRILYTWSTLYHALLKKGDTFTQLKPVISIWLLKESVFPGVTAYHLPFVAYNIAHQLHLTDHFAIHVIPLPQWHLPEKALDETDRWMYFFKEGKEVDVDQPPDILNTPEMRQAMKVLEQFSENEKNYLLYEQRLESERIELTWKAMLEQKTIEIERERQEKERLLTLLKQAGITPNEGI